MLPRNLGGQAFEGGIPLDEDKEILVVISKVKNYIRAKSGMNTSGGVAQALSDRVRELCDQAIENSRKDGRKTVMDRDLPSTVSSPGGAAQA